MMDSGNLEIGSNQTIILTNNGNSGFITIKGLYKVAGTSPLKLKVSVSDVY